MTTAELKRAKVFWVKHVQNLYFHDEICQLRLYQPISDKSCVINLNPKLNEDEILIVHGRLQYANFTEVKKFLMVLPGKKSLDKFNYKTRKKWYKENVDLFVNDLVVVIKDNMPPAKWLMARVTKIHPSNDGLIRRVTLRTKNGQLERPIVKLCKLPIVIEGRIDGGEDVPCRNKN